MVRATLLILIFLLGLGSSLAGEDGVCVINSYNVPPAKKLERELINVLREKGYTLSSNCEVKLVIGTPALIKVLKEGKFKKVIYTYVLFPEQVPIKRKNVYGIRIFPLPERTVKAFMEERGLKGIKVAVPISRDMVPIAKRYLPSKYFKLLVFKRSPSEIFDKLSSFKYVYIFPDPKLLKIVNLINLINFGRERGIVFLTGLSDLEKYGVDFVQKVSYTKLAQQMVSLIDERPDRKVLPCPVE